VYLKYFHKFCPALFNIEMVVCLLGVDIVPEGLLLFGMLYVHNQSYIVN
jgi:hypothetical protein